MKKIRKLLFYFICCFLITLPLFSIEMDALTLKAVYLERFTRFVEWPSDSSVHSPSSTFILGIMGENHIIPILKKIYASHKILNKNVKVKVINKLHDLDDCHMLFIARSEKDELPHILSYTCDKPILTVSDTKGFAKKGVMINLFSDEKNISYEINQPASQSSGLSLSYLLLQHGKTIKSSKATT